MLEPGTLVQWLVDLSPFIVPPAKLNLEPMEGVSELTEMVAYYVDFYMEIF